MQKNEKTAVFKRRLYNFVLKLVKYVESLPENRTTKIIGDQLIRSGTSILSCYIEASGASSKRDYTNYFHYSLKSANESKVWLALKELDEISQIFASSILTLKGRK